MQAGCFQLHLLLNQVCSGSSLLIAWGRIQGENRRVQRFHLVTFCIMINTQHEFPDPLWTSVHSESHPALVPVLDVSITWFEPSMHCVRMTTFTTAVPGQQFIENQVLQQWEQVNSIPVASKLIQTLTDRRLFRVLNRSACKHNLV